MGTTFSSNKDYNRILATQPRRSIDIPKFGSPNNLHEQTPTDLFLIPDPMRISQIESQKENIASTFPSKFVESTQTFEQSNPSPIVINNQERQKSKEEQPQQHINAQNSSYSVRSNSPTYHETMTGDAVVISRSVININNQQQKKNNFSSSFRPSSTIVERNGEQFLVELKQRTERRYVQCIDETTRQKRVFEVTDSIPYRTVRPYKHKSQYQSQNNISLQSNQRPVFPSNPIDNRSSNTRVNIASKHDLQNNNINELFTNKTPQNIEYISSTALFSPQSTSNFRLTTNDAVDSIYQHSQSLLTDPKNIFNQYSTGLFHKQPPLFQAYTPIISDDSASSYTSNSSDSEEETDTDDNDIIAQILRLNESLSRHKQINSYFFDNRNSTAVSYQTNGIYSSSTPLNTFPQSLNSSICHHCRGRPTIQNYAEPVTNNHRFQQSALPDYSPSSMPIKQLNQNQYSHSNDFQKSIYDG